LDFLHTLIVFLCTVFLSAVGVGCLSLWVPRLCVHFLVGVCCVLVQSRSGVTMMAEGLARRDAVAGAALAAGIAVIVAPQAASARDKNGKETGAFASDSYAKYQKGYPKNNAPIVSSVNRLI